MGTRRGRSPHARDRQGHRRRHARDREGEPAPEGHPPEDVRPPRARQTPPRRRGRPLHEYPHEGARRHPRHPRPHLRILPLHVRRAGGQEGRRVLHARLRRENARGDPEAVPGARLRPVLRLRRHVRAVRQVRREPFRPHQRHLRLRTGLQPHHVEDGADEPRHPRHRREPRPVQRRHLF